LGPNATLAHAAAVFGILPSDFDRWELADDDGVTVAHMAALHGAMPKGFDKWELANVNGVTVAHVAAESGHLPDDFNQWHLADNDGNTVAHAFVGHIFESKKLLKKIPWAGDRNVWCLVNNYGMSVESLFRKLREATMVSDI
jgi:hypothetical protein